jgi:group I intron endonuclease
LSNKKDKYISGIYCVENLINGKKYVGLTTNLCQRGSMHFVELQSNRHHNSDMQSDYNEHGIENFAYKVLEVCSGKDLFLKENEYIKRFNAVKNGYNSTYGGETGAKFVKDFSKDAQDAIELVKKDDHAIRLSNEKDLLNKLLSLYVGKKIYSRSKTQDKFKKDFFDCISIPKKTNHRRHGIRAIQSIIEEDNLPYTIESGQGRKKPNRNKVYWLISYLK